MTKTNIHKWVAILVSFLMIGTLFSMLPITNLTASAISCQKDGFDKSRYTLSGNMAEDVATIAKSQKGRTGAQFGYTEAWCDEFVADCIENAGADSSIVGHGGTVADFESIMRQKKGAVEVSSPQVGDLVFFTYSHVEIVTKVENGTVYCAGGNNGGTGNYKTNYCAGERKLYATARLYLRPNYKNTNVEPPTNLSIQSDKSYYSMGETIQFTFTSDYATELYIPIDVNGKRKFFMDVTGRTSYSCTFDEAGDYGFYLVARNPYGEASTVYMQFQIYDSAPSDLEIHTSKKEYALGENIDFSFTSKNAAELYIPVDVNGKRKFFMDVTGKTSYSCSFDEAGDYGFYLVARNAYGEATAKYMDFKIYDTIPQNLTIETNKKIFKLGESINFKFSCDYETELYIPVDVNGKRKFFIDVTGKDSYSCTFDEVGDYGFYLVARNAYGEATAKYMEFKIISPIQGDLNQDGTLSLTDLIPLQQSLLRQTTLTADQAQLADYNGDGSINVLDLMLLKRALLAL